MYPDPGVEVGPHDDSFRYPGGRDGLVLVDIMGAKAAAATTEVFFGRHGHGADDDWIRLQSHVHDPGELGPVATVLRDGLIGHYHQLSLEQRQDGVGKSRKRRVVVYHAHHAGSGHIRDVQHDCSRVQVSEVGTVGTLRVYVGVVEPEARIEIGVALGRRLAVPLLGAREPPATSLGGRHRVAYVYYHIKLVVFGVGGNEVSRTGADVGVLAVDEPEAVSAAGVGPRCIEEGDLFGICGIAYVVNADSDGGSAWRGRLVGHQQEVTH